MSDRLFRPRTDYGRQVLATAGDEAGLRAAVEALTPRERKAVKRVGEDDYGRRCCACGFLDAHQSGCPVAAYLAALAAEPDQEEPGLDVAVGRVLAAYHGGAIDSQAMHDMGMAFDAKYPGHWLAARLANPDTGDG